MVKFEISARQACYDCNMQPDDDDEKLYIMQFKAKKRWGSSRPVRKMYCFSFIIDWCRITELQSDSNDKKSYYVI